MRNAALPLSSERMAARSGGLYMRMRSWFTATEPATKQCAKMSSPTEQSSAFVDLSPSGDGDRSAEFRTVKQAPGSVVAFPLNAQARLNQLAQEIKECFADLGVDDHSPVMLRVIGGAEPQLWIDSGSYVQFRGERGGYHIVLDDAFDMRMTFETAKIEDVSHMVRAYIVARVVDAGRAVRAWHD